jgi:TOBE domain
LETPKGHLLYGVDNSRTAGAEGAFFIRTVYLRLSRERPETMVNVWSVRISRRVFLGHFVQDLVEWEDRQLMVRRLPLAQFYEGEDVYLAIEPEHCVLLEG